MSEVLVYTCPVCGKVIRSLYQRQLDALKLQHEVKHKLKKKGEI